MIASSRAPACYKCVRVWYLRWGCVGGDTWYNHPHSFPNIQLKLKERFMHGTTLMHSGNTLASYTYPVRQQVTHYYVGLSCSMGAPSTIVGTQTPVPKMQQHLENLQHTIETCILMMHECMKCTPDVCICMINPHLTYVRINSLLSPTY